MGLPGSTDWSRVTARDAGSTASATLAQAAVASRIAATARRPSLASTV